jgi:hypothetical protein
MRYSVGSLATLIVIAIGSGNSLPQHTLHAQVAAHAPPAYDWTVSRDPFADLWFHSLAVVGYDGHGPLTLYDPRYADRARGAKAKRHVTTVLDRRASELRRVLAADSAFEVLHFLPLYFVGQEPSLVLSALRTALRGPAGVARSSSLTTAANVVAAALPTSRERDVFISLLDAVDDEWTTSFRAERSAQATEDRAIVRDLQSAWDDRFGARLAGYLASIGVTRGTILISPALGNDGRIVRGPGGAVIVAVSASRGTGIGGEDAALLRAVRELAFPLLDQLHTPLTAFPTRIAAEQARDAAAVRAGAMILDCIDATLAANYRRLFLDAIGGRAFDTAYPLGNEVEIELHRLITSAAEGGASGRTSYEN